jgi:hypothetical protein
MTRTIISMVLSFFMFVFSLVAFCIAHIAQRARRKAEREYMEKWKHEKQMAESVTDANAKKEELQSGDNRADFDATVGVLHDYAQKRR